MSSHKVDIELKSTKKKSKKEQDLSQQDVDDNNLTIKNSKNPIQETERVEEGIQLALEHNSASNKKKLKKQKKEKEEYNEKVGEPQEESLTQKRKKDDKEQNYTKSDEALKTTENLVVHSANNWEQAELGDDSRKMKFLKLMGAAKHKDAEDPSKKHFRSKIDTEKINQDLEKQFVEGISAKVQQRDRGHIGLGFGNNTSDTQSTSPSSLKSSSGSMNFDKSKFKMNFVRSGNN